MMPPSFSPTARQLDALRYIRGYQIAHNGASPRLVEIADALGLCAKSGVFRLLTGLERRNLIRRIPARERAIELLVPVDVPFGPNGDPLFFVQVHTGGPPYRGQHFTTSPPYRPSPTSRPSSVSNDQPRSRDHV